MNLSSLFLPTVRLENARLKKENDHLKAQVWVLKDSQLRTYDGLAMKADKYDILRECVVKHLSTLTTFNNYKSIKEVETALKETLNELEQTR